MNTNTHHTQLNMHKHNDESKTKTNYSTTVVNQYNNNSYNNKHNSISSIGNCINKQSYHNHNKRSSQSKIKQLIYDNHNSHDKIATIKHDSTSLDKIDLSQIEKKYKDIIIEKDRTINQLKAEISVFKKLLKTPQLKKKNLKLTSSSIDGYEGIKLNDKLLTERLNDFYTPKANKIFKSLNTNIKGSNLNNFKQWSINTPIRNQYKSAYRTCVFKSFYKNANYSKMNSFNKSDKNADANHLRNFSTKASNISKTKSFISPTTTPTCNNNNNTISNTNTNSNTNNNNNNNANMLNQLKQKAKFILSKYYKLNQDLISLNNVK